MSAPPPITANHPSLRSCVLLLLSLLTLAAYARGPEPPQRIPLEPFGFQTISSRYLLEGATMFTVDYVDSQHLLITFGISRLMPRLADCPSDDEDRVVKAALLELPTGRELAHTEWRFHDLGQYLWDLGDGHFLLRKRDALTIVSPLANVASSNAFTEQPFLHYDRRIQAIIVSARRNLLSIESAKRLPKFLPAIAQPVSQPAQNQSSIPTTGLQRRDLSQKKSDSAPTQVDFLRVVTSELAPAQLHASNTSLSPHLSATLAGRIFTSNPVNVPVTTEGFLRTKATTRDGVLLDFLSFDGKDIELGDFTTSCPPRPTFVSSSEFVAFGCRGSVDAPDLAGFNLRGDFLWQINFDDEQAYPSFVSAIPAGRFAFSRTVTATHVFGNETPSMSQLTAQEVRVVQMYNGKQLLKVVTSPIQRAGQNFTLSPDGLSLAVIHDNPTVKADVVTHHTSIEIYKLPPLSDKDQAQVKFEASLAPIPSTSHMRFSAEEIKAALAAKPEIDESTSADSSATAEPDSHIVGDPTPKPAMPVANAAPSTGIIPSSDPAPACANLAEAPSGTSSCPVEPQPKSSPADTESAPEKRRKPPTLYEPVPATPPQ